MSKEEFFKYVKENILGYLPEKYATAFVDSRQTTKYNDVVKTGIVVKEEGNVVAPIIYLDELYEEYKQRENAQRENLLEEIMKTIANAIVEDPGVEEYRSIWQNYTNFECVKSRIVMEVVNVGRNMQYLQSVPYSTPGEVKELAIIYKVIISEPGQEKAAIRVQNEHLKLWGVDVDTLYSYALDNSKRIYPAKAVTIKDMMQERFPDYFSENDIFDFMPELSAPMYVITNKQNTLGAAAIFYSDALKEIAEEMGQDLYILPSSIHEVLVISSALGSPEELGEMVKDINKTLSPEEVLSDHVFGFSAKDQKIIDETEMSTANQKIASAAMNNPRHHR